MRFKLLFVCSVFLFISGLSAASTDAALLKKTTGVISYVGKPSGKLTNFPKKTLVNILIKDKKSKRELSEKLINSNLAGKVSINTLYDAEHLPYPDNFVNLLIIADGYKVPVSEALRVLVPGGIAKFAKGKTIRKKHSSKVDDWPQWMHGADNVVVSKDKLVGPPRHLQWLQSPPWGRMHNDMEIPAPGTFVLTKNGRVFYDVDTGHPEALDLAIKFQLYARDAFNGLLLWQRPLPDWYKDREYRRGNPPVVIQRRLACYKDLLFLTESDEGPVQKIDAATGKTLAVFPGTENAMEVVVAGNALYVVKWKKKGTKVIGYNERKGYASKFYPSDTPKDKLPKQNLKVLKEQSVDTSLMKIDIASGRTLWEKEGDDVSKIFPQSLSAVGGFVYFKMPELLVCLKASDGSVSWKTKIGCPKKDYVKITTVQKVWGTPWSAWFRVLYPNPWYVNVQFVGKCIVYKDLVLTTTYNKLYAVSKNDGKILWTCKSWEGFFLPPDIIPIDDTVYVGSDLGNGGFYPVDIKTGKMNSEIKISKGGMVHHRCYRRIATSDYLLSSKAGIELHNIKDGTTSLNQWTRACCLAGFIPSYGLIYMTPHPCSCFTKVKMNGMLAYGADHGKPSDLGAPIKTQLEKGPAYGKKLKNKKINPKDWCGYRHDIKRSGTTTAVVGAKLKQAWKISVGGEPASIAAAGNSVYVSAKNKNILYCFDTETGKKKWAYMTGGRIDSAPTVEYGFVVFGSADGWLYCLDADTGKLVWRYHPAEVERLVGVFGQLESAWPIHGAVVVTANNKFNDGRPVVYANAGRNSFLDKGIRLCGVDLQTGKLIAKKTLWGPYDKDGNPISEKQWQLNGVKNDILISDGDFVYIKDDAFDLNLKSVESKGKPHIIATGLSMLDPYRHHRSLWIIGKDTPYGPTMNYAGELLSVYGKKIYAFRAQNGQRNCGGRAFKKYGLGQFDIIQTKEDPAAMKKLPPWLQISIAKAQQKWRTTLSLIADSMIFTGAGSKGDEVLFMAGSVNPGNPAGLDKALDGKGDSFLQARSASDGKLLAKYTLNAPPVFDGMAALPGKLFVPLKDGSILCFAKEK